MNKNNLNKWIVTDCENKIEEYTQYVKKLSDKKFRVIEHDDLSGDNADKFVARECIIDLNDFDENEILEYLEPYGYTETQEPQITAECIAEQEMETTVISDNFKDIVNWEEKQGINYIELFK